MIERTLQRYRLIEEVGQGGMAVVYKGFDTTLNREVAVKVLHPHLAGQEESRARLQREAHAVAKLRHENILEIFDYSGPDSPESYIVTEFIHGKTLKIFLGEHPLELPEIAEMIASEVARALEHAHSLGVIHRDVKPENVMIRDDGILKLMDFGIAQIVDKERMTVTGQLLGSPAYMAPEHVEGKPLDFRTDVFAVGILTYQLATGELPFRGKNPHEVLKRIADCHYAPPEVVNPLIGARLARTIRKALARDPNDRFPDVAPLRRELVGDLADVGIDDPRQELKAFFPDPKGWTRAFRPKLVARLAVRGRELEKAGRTAAALELWSRALALEPNSNDLRTLVDGVSRRRRFGRAGIGAALAILVAGALALSARWLLHRAPRSTTTHASPNLNPRPEPKPEPKPEPTATSTPPPKLATPRHAFIPPRIVHPAPPKARDFLLIPSPKSVKVAIDDAKGFSFNPGAPTISLAADREHVIHFSGDCCVQQSVHVPADKPPGEIKVHLEWRPARLIIDTEPPGADILIDSSRVLRSGHAFEVTFNKNEENPKKLVRVEVSAAGYRSRSVDITIVPGDDKKEQVTLVKEGAE